MDEACFRRTAPSFDYPDFIDVTLHSDRGRHGLVAGDPRYEATERLIAAQPPIAVPTISLDGRDDSVMPVGGAPHEAAHFRGAYEHRWVDGAGHNLPQEAPAEFAAAVPDPYRKT